MMRPTHPTLLLAATLCAALPAAARADSIVLTAVADATLIESVDATQYALGAAYNIYCGRVGTNGGGTLRRALVRFDLSAIPAGSTVTSASLKVYMSQTNTGTQSTALHRVLQSWGEGASFAFGGAGTNPEPGDATWTNRFYPGQPWSTPGGVFVETATQTKSIGAAGAYVFASNAAMVADVQSWIASPASNFGWIMRGNETTLGTAKRFESRESGDPARRPLLTVVYTPPPPVGDLNGDGKVNGADLGLLLGAWGSAGASDLDASGVTDGADLAILLGNWRP
jgi:hypothetical protein